jgi:hypothetical protein
MLVVVLKGMTNIFSNGFSVVIALFFLLRILHAEDIYFLLLLFDNSTPAGFPLRIINRTTHLHIST